VEFRWIESNVALLAEYGIEAESGERVVEAAMMIPYPRRIGEDKLLVWGRGPAGEWQRR